LIPGSVPFARKSSVAPPPVDTKREFLFYFHFGNNATVSPPPMILSAREPATQF